MNSWNGSPINSSGEGVVLKRNKNIDGSYVDTNTSKDWINHRRYGIGQSNFIISKIRFSGEIKTFISPDNSYNAIVNELRNANESVLLNIYEFTNPFLCDELVYLLRRNVSIKIFLEGSPVLAQLEDWPR